MLGPVLIKYITKQISIYIIIIIIVYEPDETTVEKNIVLPIYDNDVHRQNMVLRSPLY